MRLNLSNRSLFVRESAYEPTDKYGRTCDRKLYNVQFIRGEKHDYDYDRILRIELTEKIETTNNRPCCNDKLTFDLVLRIYCYDVERMLAGQDITALATEMSELDLSKIEELFYDWERISLGSRMKILSKIKDQYVRRLRKIKRQARESKSVSQS